MNRVPDIVSKSWDTIAPLWPLKSLVAVNPLRGFEHLPFKQALEQGHHYFQQPSLPPQLETINRHTIKWCQAFFDEGQATLAMPSRHLGLYHAWRALAEHDTSLHNNNTEKKAWLQSLPSSTDEVITTCLDFLGIAQQDRELFLTLLLTTLPGWAGHIKYRTAWSANNTLPVSTADYSALRLVITCLLWPDAQQLVTWHHDNNSKHDYLQTIQQTEKHYHQSLLQQLATHKAETHTIQPSAHFVFCIDTRSEPLRRSLEACGNYTTHSMAGFFGLPLHIEDKKSKTEYTSCPVLIPPHATVRAFASTIENSWHQWCRSLNTMYKTVKNAFATPFALVEALGPLVGTWMSFKTWAPRLAQRLAATTYSNRSLLSLEEVHQVDYAYNALQSMGLTTVTAPLVILCGHTSTSTNNAYESILKCGACAGNSGVPNARLLAELLNDTTVREQLTKRGCVIPDSTRFIAAEHDTTTSTLSLESNENNQQLMHDIQKAATGARHQQAKKLTGTGTKKPSVRSADWAQVRPEWGLARNASFIIGSRSLTQKSDLEGRAFLHSYEWYNDKDGTILTAILTAPVVVAQWINTQYLFSTLDPVAYGSGSKITLNISGKIGCMQGNASDLMTGLPLQSVYTTDIQPYHEPARLMVVIQAPHERILASITSDETVTKLVKNEWITVVCYEPNEHQLYELDSAMKWQQLNY